MRDKGPQGVRVGYLRASEVLSRVFNVCFSLLLLLAAAPVMLLITVVILVRDGLPIFYSGLRLGRDKKLFTMYKFRTLVPDAQDRIGAELFTARLAANRELLTKSGEFLRYSRLDELPQLFNVLRGDMDILGPRPERPEIYNALCKDIPGYDYRFRVKPGLIGYSQLFTPHSTPKRIRHRIDVRFLFLRHRYSFEVLVVISALAFLFKRMLAKMVRVLAKAVVNLFTSRREKRALERLQPKQATVLVADRADGGGVAGTLKDINEEALLMYADAELPAGELSIRIVVPVRFSSGREVKKTIYCRGQKYAESAVVPEPHRFGFVIKYAPLSPRNAYLIHQYLLQGSIVSNQG